MKTASGAAAVQIMYSPRRGSWKASTSARPTTMLSLSCYECAEGLRRVTADATVGSLGLTRKDATMYAPCRTGGSALAQRRPYCAVRKVE